MAVLRTDGFFANRMVASAVLVNFSRSDSTWWTLVRALRDPHEVPRGFAEIVLRTMPRQTVDWTPAVGDLRLLLGGMDRRSLIPIQSAIGDGRFARSSSDDASLID